MAWCVKGRWVPARSGARLMHARGSGPHLMRGMRRSLSFGADGGSARCSVSGHAPALASVHVCARAKESRAAPLCGPRARDAPGSAAGVPGRRARARALGYVCARAPSGLSRRASKMVPWNTACSLSGTGLAAGGDTGRCPSVAAREAQAGCAPRPPSRPHCPRSWAQALPPTPTHTPEVGQKVPRHSQPPPPSPQTQPPAPHLKLVRKSRARSQSAIGSRPAMVADMHTI